VDKKPEDQLVSEGRCVHITFVGDGPDRAELLQEVKKRNLENVITFAGAVDQDNIHRYYGNTDIFVLPSFAEGIPIVLMEALAMEIPCISTYVNGIPELIRHGVDGLLVTPTDEQELAHSIAKLMEDPDLCKRLGKSGRERVIEHYNLEKNVDRLVDLFSSYWGSHDDRKSS